MGTRCVDGASSREQSASRTLQAAVLHGFQGVYKEAERHATKDKKKNIRSMHQNKIGCPQHLPPQYNRRFYNGEAGTLEASNAVSLFLIWRYVIVADVTRSEV